MDFELNEETVEGFKSARKTKRSKELSRDADENDLKNEKGRIHSKKRGKTKNNRRRVRKERVSKRR